MPLNECEDAKSRANSDKELEETQPRARVLDAALEARYREWIAGILQRDQAILAVFYDHTVSYVYGLALRIVRDRATAEEVCVDVYWQVWRDARHYDATRGRVLTWLLTIARTRALDALRRRADSAMDAKSEWLLANTPSMESQPDDLLQAAREGSTVRAALARLRPIQRQVLALAFFRGYTHEEIAQHAQVPVGTVKTHIRRGLAALRAHFTTTDDSAQ